MTRDTREDVEALADLIDEAERGLAPGSNDTDAWQNRVANAILSSSWLAAHDEGVRAIERERLAAERKQRQQVPVNEDQWATYSDHHNLAAEGDGFGGAVDRGY